MSEQHDDPHWALKQAQAKMHDAFDDYAAALVAESMRELSRQQVPVLHAQDAAKAQRVDDMAFIHDEQMAQDKATELRGDATALLMQSDEDTLHDLARRIRALEAAHAAEKRGA